MAGSDAAPMAEALAARCALVDATAHAALAAALAPCPLPPVPTRSIAKARPRQSVAAGHFSSYDIVVRAAEWAHNATKRDSNRPADATPARLATAIAAALRKDATNVHSAHVVGGVKVLVCSMEHRRSLARHGALACPICGHVCRDVRGVRCHALLQHPADADDMTKRNRLAVLATKQNDETYGGEDLVVSRAAKSRVPFALALARDGCLVELREAHASGKCDVAKERDKRGAGALLWAAGSGREAVVEWLLHERLSDPLRERDVDGRSALSWAARGGHVSLLRLFVKRCGMDVNEQTADGTSAVMWAAWGLHEDACAVLVNELGADPTAVNHHGCNVAQWLAMAPRENFDEGAAYEEAVLRLLWFFVQNGMNDPLRCNKNRHSPLHKAAMLGNAQMCLWLVGASMAIAGGPQRPALLPEHVEADWDGMRPSDYATIAEHAVLAEALRQAEARMGVVR